MLPHILPKTSWRNSCHVSEWAMALHHLENGKCKEFWNGQSEIRTAVVSPLSLRQMIPNESFRKGQRQLPAESPHPAHYFPVQRTSLTSTTAVSGYGMSFLMLEGAADPWKQCLSPPHSSGTEFRVVRVLFAPHCGSHHPMSSCTEQAVP